MKQRYQPDTDGGFLERLKERVSLADLIGQKVKLQRKGHEYTGLCPFHSEKTPSFYVVEEKGFYHCFGCGVHGDALGWLMETERLGFRQALEQLAHAHGMALPQRDQVEEKKRYGLYETVELACRYYTNALYRDFAPRRYLEERGISQETIEIFRLGYAPKMPVGDFIAWFRDHDIDTEKLKQVGLLLERDNGQLALRFQNRLIFPIGNSKNQIIAFGGRLLSGEGAKYINSPETPLFIKGEQLYNQARARKMLDKDAVPVLVEGYMDCIALDQAGVTGVVAPLGTALSEQQLLRLWRIGREPILCFDGDQAGVRAAFRAATRALPLLRPQHSLRFVFLPEGEDPDSLVRRGGKTAFYSYYDQARPLYDVLWQQAYLESPVDTPEARAGLEIKLNDYVAQIKNRTIAHHYQRAFKDLLWRHFRNAGVGQAKKILPQSDHNRRFHHILLVTLCHHPALIDELEESLLKEVFDFELDKCFEILQKLRVNFPDCDGKILRQNVLERKDSVLPSLLQDRRIVRLAPFSCVNSSFEDALAGINKMLKIRHIAALDDEMNALRGNNQQAQRRSALYNERRHILTDILNAPMKEMEPPK